MAVLGDAVILAAGRSPLGVTAEAVVAAGVGLFLYRVTRPYNRDRYWRSWLQAEARPFSWASVACGAAGGVLAVVVALITHTTITAVPALDGLLLGFLSWAVVKTSVEGYGITPWAKVGMLTSLGASWMETDLNERTQERIAAWAFSAPLDTIKETVHVQYVQDKLKKQSAFDRDKATLLLHDITTRLTSHDPQVSREAETDLRALAAQMMIDNRTRRP